MELRIWGCRSCGKVFSTPYGTEVCPRCGASITHADRITSDEIRARLGLKRKRDSGKRG